MGVERRIKTILMLERMSRKADIAMEIGIRDASHYKNAEPKEISVTEKAITNLLAMSCIKVNVTAWGCVRESCTDLRGTNGVSP